MVLGQYIHGRLTRGGQFLTVARRRFSGSSWIGRDSGFDRFTNELGYELPTDWYGRKTDNCEPNNECNALEQPEFHTFSIVVIVLNLQNTSSL